MVSVVSLVAPSASNVFISCPVPRSVEFRVNPNALPQSVALSLQVDVSGNCVTRILRHFRCDVTDAMAC